MSFRLKTVLAMVLLSLAPYVITMVFLGNAYRSDFESRLRSDMENQLQVTLQRLDQHLLTVKNDLAFMASLDIMNDVLTGDIDRRILDLIQLKKEDLNLIGEFEVSDSSGRVVASTDIGRIGQSVDQNAFASLSLLSTFNQSPIGTLQLFYDEQNLTRNFGSAQGFQYQLLDQGQALNDANDSLTVRGNLQQWPGKSVALLQDRDFAFALLQRAERSFLAALGIGTLVIGLIAAALASYLIAPVLLLASAAREVTRTENYDHQVKVNRNDELGELAAAFNRMMAGMRDLLQRLREESENRLRLAEEKNRSEMLRELSEKLSRYLSPQIYQSIFSGERDVALESSRKKLTIFFSDIVDFTSTTDQMESEDLTNLLNQYLREMTDIALAHGATIDKYIGDAIMIFFGDPETEGVAEDAARCVEMAAAMQKRVCELQEEWLESGFAKPFSIRIGIHTGYCTVGNFGTDNRMDYTIVGSAVNLASRIESAAEAGNVVVSEDTWLLLRDRFDFVPAGTVTPKGFSHPVPLYRLATVGDAQQAIELNGEGVSLSVDPGKLDATSRRQLREILKKF